MTGYAEEGMAEETPMDLSNPHVILTCVSEADAQIAKLRQQREKYLARYQEVMQGYEQHWHSVMNKPEEDSGYDSPMPIPRSW